MSSFTKRLILAAMCLPFAAYIASQWLGVVGHSAAAMPSSRMPDRDKAAKWKAESKYKTDVGQGDLQAASEFKGVERGPFKDALVEREWTMKNGRPFLVAADFGESPTFGGDRADRFKPHYKQIKDIIKCREEYKAWDERDVQLPASSYLTAFGDEIIKPFRDCGAPPEMIAEYSLRGRYKVVVAFSRDLAKRYDKSLAESSTLPVERSEDLTTEMAAILKLYEECKKFDAPSVRMDTSRDEQDWKARLELLKLFAKDPYKLSPPDARGWFEDVNKHHGNLKDDSTKRLIREKVQQFCGQYVPPKLALDKVVQIKEGAAVKAEDRTKVKARYEVNGKETEGSPLTADPEGLNEMTKDKSPPGVPLGAKFSLYGLPGGSTTLDKFVEPTPLSVASFAYFKARQDIPATNGWNRRTAGALLEKAGPAGPNGDHNWNKLSRLVVDGEYKVYDRLKIVEEAVKKFTALFPE